MSCLLISPVCSWCLGQSSATSTLHDAPIPAQEFSGGDPHSPLLSALCFGGSGSGRHGQGPSQRVVRLLPVEQAWNSNLHCKRETQQVLRMQPKQTPYSASFQCPLLHKSRQSRERSTSSRGLNYRILNKKWPFIFYQMQRITSKNTVEALEDFL